MFRVHQITPKINVFRYLQIQFYQAGAAIGGDKIEGPSAYAFSLTSGCYMIAQGDGRAEAIEPFLSLIAGQAVYFEKYGAFPHV